MTGPSTHETGTPDERIILTTPDDTVRLMQLVPEDDQAYYDLIAADPEHLRAEGITDKYPDAAAVRQTIEHPDNPEKYRFGIWDGDTLVGSNNLTPKGEGKAELGSWVGGEHIGKSYASRARRLLLDFAFNTLGLEEVFSDIVVDNEKSRRSILKSGFELQQEYTDPKDGAQVWRYVKRRPTQNAS